MLMLIILSYLLSTMLCEMNPVEKQYYCKTKQMVECIILLSISFAISAWSNMIAIGGHQFIVHCYAMSEMIGRGGW